ncbi:PspA/IM30 family protein [Clostridium magnum]|uniref:Phage shock protein A n=1 Tax=Clostridium magnum DSM 2767 TaxID=1121326 RepID=A0A162R7U7_9CLOT|nr:PspA/IM30 family protein [Clostridium magnum]KZL89551.1 phage shock protein A [Clostridium magnum DSM 2767]SHH72165.1 phage shock protein A (PspA) family protein [Clostridium magnum DSM 2767]
MGIFKRMSNIIRAKANNSLDEIENPIELLDQKVRDMEESLNKAKLSSAKILGNVHEIEKKIEKAEAESKDYDEKVRLAMNKGNEELAKKALEKKLEADKMYTSLKGSYDDARTKAEAIKKKLKDLEEEVQKTRNYRDEAAARYNNAEASGKVNEILASVETKSNKISLDDIERKIQKKEAFSQGLEELKVDNSLNKEFEKLEEVNLDEELKKYKLS